MNPWKVTGISLAAAALVLALLVLAFPARSHEAPTGWSYPLECCSGQDCRPAAEGEVVEEAGGYRVTSAGLLIPYGDRRIRFSPDGLYHICMVPPLPDPNGPAAPRIPCLFVPPGSA